MFENLTIGHILFVLVVVLLIFGAKRVPEMGKSLGQGIREFRKSFSQVEHREETPREESRAALSEPRSLERHEEKQREEQRVEPKRLLP